MKAYSVECGMHRGTINADSPKKALIKFMKQCGYNISVGKSIDMGTPAKVCLLGGTKESVSYYTVLLVGSSYD